ncbi:NERD domain-containing protein [Oceanirhabdus sp. W0125-5]|uniref:NERD domain-containing protein n=1 Tax=Oceanirhabdus sp. W0125-5 TaxID=2999116 RepID=UPI0022F33F7F|nr:NERD domain-containing protein [Oceanirhabdus sp. W0125-5]WBW96258.1 NERD domain-containing protein [Oceanirhabdus sp. W0125-5]
MVWAIIIVTVILLLSSPKVKGYLGEKSVSIRLKGLNEEEYKILNDVYLPTNRGKTTQVDHLVVSLYGIFVIETKNYKGWITGTEKSEFWTQTIYKTKNKLYNPLRQNYGHVMAVKELIKGVDVPIIPIVAFSDRADLKVKIEKEHVVYIPQIKKVILKYNEKKITKEQMSDICNLIQGAELKDKNVKKAHVKEIRKDVREKNEKVSKNICPKCGGELVKRKGKYGEFVGCSNFPGCRFVGK